MPLLIIIISSGSPSGSTRGLGIFPSSNDLVARPEPNVFIRFRRLTYLIHSAPHFSVLAVPHHNIPPLLSSLCRRRADPVGSRVPPREPHRASRHQECQLSRHGRRRRQTVRFFEGNLLSSIPSLRRCDDNRQTFIGSAASGPQPAAVPQDDCPEGQRHLNTLQICLFLPGRIAALAVPFVDMQPPSLPPSFCCPPPCGAQGRLRLQSHHRDGDVLQSGLRHTVRHPTVRRLALPAHAHTRRSEGVIGEEAVTSGWRRGDGGGGRGWEPPHPEASSPKHVRMRTCWVYTWTRALTALRCALLYAVVCEPGVAQLHGAGGRPPTA